MVCCRAGVSTLGAGATAIGRIATVYRDAEAGSTRVRGLYVLPGYRSCLLPYNDAQSECTWGDVLNTNRNQDDCLHDVDSAEFCINVLALIL